MNVLAIIPARGGSKRLPGKNIRNFCGKPLIAWTIDAALKAKTVDRVVVSTDDEEIAEISKKFNAEVPFLRPKKLAKDSTPTLPVLQHTVRMLRESDGWEADIVLTLQPTSPLRTEDHIDEAVELFENHSDADSLVSCIEIPHRFRPKKLMTINKDGYLDTLDQFSSHTLQDKSDETYFARNGAAIYLTKREKLDDFIIGGKVVPYIMKDWFSIDIDTEFDFFVAESILSSILNNTLNTEDLK